VTRSRTGVRERCPSCHSCPKNLEGWIRGLDGSEQPAHSHFLNEKNIFEKNGQVSQEGQGSLRACHPPKKTLFKSDIARARSDKRGKAPWALHRKRKMPFDPSLPRCGPTPG
jgi:hypothetical protein